MLWVYVRGIVQEARLTRIHTQVLFDNGIPLTGWSMSCSIWLKPGMCCIPGLSPTCWQRHLTSKTVWTGPGIQQARSVTKCSVTANVLVLGEEFQLFGTVFLAFITSPQSSLPWLICSLPIRTPVLRIDPRSSRHPLLLHSIFHRAISQTHMWFHHFFI